MTSANRLIGVILGCWILVNSASVFSQDWPQWRGPHRDGKVSGFTPPQAWPKTLVQKWKTTVGSGDATPALVGDKLYVFTRQGDDELILCLNAADGKQLWQSQYAAKAVTGPAARQHQGPRSSPTIAEGKVVTLGASGVVCCVDAATGKELWRNEDYKSVPRFYTSTSPIVVDGMAIVQLGGTDDGTTVAFDLASGNPKWKWAGEGPGYASPVLMTVEGVKQIVTLTDKSLVGIGVADGKVLWHIPFEPKGMSYNAATPIVDGQTVIVTGQGRGTKAVKVEKTDGGYVAKVTWSNDEVAPQFNSPVLKDGLLFGMTGRGNLFCLNAQTGKTAWTDATARSRGFCAMLDAGSVILALPDNSQLIAFKPDGKQYSELAKIKVSDTATYATPVVAGKQIFVKDRDAVTLWSLE
jgi:outer membrane protein assembly factor BamB